MLMPRLSLTMIVKNEGKYLDECLASAKDIADEIIVVDTGSTDNTIEIAKKYNAQVYNFKWVDDFSAARNYALSKSTGEWILYLDADERVDSNSLAELKRIKNSSEKAGYYCTVKSIDNENNRDNSMRYIRLFRNIEGISFSGKVHEQITCSLTEKGIKLFNSNILITHLGYNIPAEEKKVKAERNLKLLLDEFEKDKSGYYAFQMANTYSIIENIADSAKYYKIAVESNDLTKTLKAECYANLALFSHKEFDSENAILYIDKSLKLNSDQPFVYLLASKIRLQQGNKPEAENYCKKAYLVNKQQLNGVNRNDLQVYLDNEEVICYGFLLALQNNSKDNFNFYLEEYVSYLRKVNSGLSKALKPLVIKLLSKQPLNVNDEEALVSLINRNSAELFYSLLDNAISCLKEEFAGELYNKFKTDIAVVKLYSKYYAENNNISRAIEILEMNISRVEEDPTAIIYLISYCLTAGLPERVKELITILEGKYAHLTLIAQIIENIKGKIKSMNKN
jgi:glycosyltransferase involved in cell wall biosynthesis